MSNILYTVGHSTHSLEVFLALLKRHGVNAIADIRSHPRSRFNPQYNRKTLCTTLKEAGIVYAFIGRELGARPEDQSCYKEGKVQYNLLAKTKLFQEGLARVERGMVAHRIALLCAEKDPLTCHRAILVCRHLVDRGIEARHILADGQLENHDAALEKLLSELKLHSDDDLIDGRKDLIQTAYEHRSEQIAYTVKKSPDNKVANKVER